MQERRTPHPSPQPNPPIQTQSRIHRVNTTPHPKLYLFKSTLIPLPLTFSCDYKTVCMFGRLPELLLLPGRRIHEYVTLLSWFELHTPSTHQDRADLADAIETLKVVNRHVQEVGIELSPLTQSCNGLVQEVGIELFPLTLFFKKKHMLESVMELSFLTY